MFVFRKVTGDVYGCKLYFIFFSLYNLHTFKMAANMLKTYYYNFNVHIAHVAARVFCNIGYGYVMNIYILGGSHMYSVN